MGSNTATAETPTFTWKDVCERATLGQFDGFHVDTDERGRILMTPVTFTHGALAYRVARLIDDATADGTVVREVGVRTRRGVKAPDVMWSSPERVAERTDEYDDERAGEICVEVLSTSNHPREIEEHRRLYFEQGAREVWVCAVDGTMTFWVGPDERADASSMIPAFPGTVAID